MWSKLVFFLLLLVLKFVLMIVILLVLNFVLMIVQLLVLNFVLMIVLLLVLNFVLMIVLLLALNFVLMIDMSRMTHTLLANSRENDPGASLQPPLACSLSGYFGLAKL